ncbi:MAG: hypothetical protein MI922_25165, partial [Bacteroidales bacterium]|nr:hypothetical protein [Bacteroidales bacterium]
MTKTQKKNINPKVDERYKIESIAFSKSLRSGLLMGAFLCATFACLDVNALPQHKNTALVIRFGVAFPFLMCIYVLTYFDVYHKYGKILISLVAQLVGLGSLALVFLADETNLGYNYYFATLILVILWIHLFLRIGYKTATINTVFLT